MSKSKKTGLTGLRKKRATPKKKHPAEPHDLDGAREAYDRAIDFLGRILTLAGLLEVPGRRRDAEELNAVLVHEAGCMILEEAERLRGALETIHRNL
jgi:hypothetical protein